MQTALAKDVTGTLSNSRFETLLYWGGEYTLAQVAAKMYRSVWWADKEIRIIYKLLGVRSRQGAIMKAWKLGIFTKENTG